MTIQENGLAVAKLISILDTPLIASGVRVAAVQGLGRAGGPVALAKLINLFDTPLLAAEVREACARAIGEAGRLE